MWPLQQSKLNNQKVKVYVYTVSLCRDVVLWDMWRMSHLFLDISCWFLVTFGETRESTWTITR